MSKSENREEEVALVLIGHGSVLPYNKELMCELQSMIERRGIFKAVRVAFMQINSPSIGETFKQLVEEGVKDIVALPVFLANGVHTTKDIPSELERFSEGRKGEVDVNIIYGKPIGVDERIVDVLLDRVKEALEEE